jgi:hypothetical protein
MSEASLMGAIVGSVFGVAAIVPFFFAAIRPGTRRRSRDRG